MSESNPLRLARELAVARRTHGFVAPEALESLKDFGAAYEVQEAVRSEMGAAVVGWKVAAPPSGEVIAAPIFDISCMHSGGLLAEAALLRDGVECELALRIDRPLPSQGCTRDDVIAAVGAVMPAFELLCSRLPGRFASPRSLKPHAESVSTETTMVMLRMIFMRMLRPRYSRFCQGPRRSSSALHRRRTSPRPDAPARPARSARATRRRRCRSVRATCRRPAPQA